MYSLEALSDHSAHPEQLCTLCRPVARTARAVLLTRENDQRNALSLIFHRRVVNAHSLAAGLMNRHSAFDAGNHQVFDPHVRERSASHHAIVSAARAVAVEVRD